MARYLLDLKRVRADHAVGGKAQGLRFLLTHGWRVPTTWVCPWDVTERVQRGDVEAAQAIERELAALIDPLRRYAVRSSSNLEDTTDYAGAGQFATFLDVQGVDAVWRAVQAVWASARSPQAQAYLAKSGRNPEDLKMAALVQEMVPPSVSGVAFSCNPITGRDEIVVEAVRGRGDQLVQAGVTPARWVYKWGGWSTTPAETDIPQSLVEEVVVATRRIAHAYRRPVDLEWVYDGASLYWVQLRPITALAGATIYSNRIAREVLPGLIKPLVWSINTPLVNRAWVRLFTELIGPNDLDPLSLAKTFYYRAYFNMTAIGRVFELLGLPPESLELLLGLEEGESRTARPSFRPTRRTLRHLPRALKFLVEKARFGSQAETALMHLRARFDALAAVPIAQSSEEALLTHIDDLYAVVEEAAYLNIVVPLLMHIYTRLLQRELARYGATFDETDAVQEHAELRELNPAAALEPLRARFHALAPETQAAIRDGGYAVLCQRPEAHELAQAIDAYLARFGHLSESGNDFSVAPWRETPDLIVRLIAEEVQARPQARAPSSFDALPVPRWRRPWVRWLAARARRFRLYREQVSSLYTFGYGLFRTYFLALGERLTRRGVLSAQEDIFYLTFDEVIQLVRGTDRASDPRVRVAQRRQELMDAQHVTPPTLIYGEEAPPLVREEGAPGRRRWRGIPTARGYYRGPARVVRGAADFARVQAGDVLVIPFADVAWTPLFAKAGAVVAGSGGMLSHSSIVAREYGIPAVVSVSEIDAIADGMIVTVDGYRGEVIASEAG